MNKVTIYCECADFGDTADGAPCPAGVAITIGETEKTVDYEKLTAGVNLDALADLIHAPHGTIRIISPEDYREKYGDDEEETD